MGLTDPFGRTITYLRLSITDRCNMRCVYCMPADGIPLLTHNDILSYEAFLLIAKTAVAAGVEKIRITGGEPLVRRGIVPFLERLAAIPGLRQLALTTNGLHLHEMAGELRRAGVQRLNISLDSLRPETFARITRGADLQQVMRGIAAAGQVGFPLKINVVVMAGVNDGEILDFAAMTLDRPLTVRFIEYMPTLRSGNGENLTVPGKTILDRIGQRYRISPLERESLAGPAKLFRIDGAAGDIGVITPISGHFCGECNRIRVTATGTARGCLFAGSGVELKPFLDAGDEAGLGEALRGLVARKPARHLLAAAEQHHAPFAMSAIGG